MTGAEEHATRAKLDAVGLRLMRQTGTYDGQEVWEVACKQCSRTIDVCIRRYVAETHIGPWCGRCGEAVG